MKILFLTLGNISVASSRTRVFQYLPYLKQYGVKSQIVIYNSFIFDKRKSFFFQKYVSLNVQIKLLIFILLAPFYNVVFIQKVFLPIFYLKILKLFNKKIVFDFDDAIYMDACNDSISDDELKQFNYILKISSTVLLENEETESYARGFNFNVVKITGPIDCSRYFPTKKAEQGIVTIGWIGSPSTTKYLALVKDALDELSKKYGNKVQLVTIGADGFKCDSLTWINYKWELRTEVELLKKFDIGIMPLPDDKWSKGKGGYKLLQYMAIGIPSVASPVGINKELIKNSLNGFLAEDTLDWFKKLSFLIDNYQIRNDMGIKALNFVKENFSFEHYTKLFLESLK